VTRRRLVSLLLLAAAALGALAWLHRRPGPLHYTGFVEGEERVLRAEVSGRVLAMDFREGAEVPAGAVVARIDPSDIDARIASKQREIDVAQAQIDRQEEQVKLADATWQRDVGAQAAALRQAEADAGLAARDLARTESLHAGGVASSQQLDQALTRRDATRSAVDRANDLLGRARAQEREITLARRQVEVLKQQLGLARAQLGELQVTRSKYDIRAPAVPTVVQTQLLWPGELAQPGTPVLSVIAPRDKYVQIYIPVEDAGRLRVGSRVEIELDSDPGHRVPGEVVTIADEANFTPEKIETRSDRIGQVYRAKVRILEDVERFRPGTEGNVYLVASPPDGEARQADAQ
jgi:HlyD family secretion protein